MVPEPYRFDPEYQSDDREPQYPYQDYYGDGGQTPKRPSRRGGGHGGWVVLVILLVVAAGAIFLLRRYAIEIRRTDGGLTFSIQDASAEPDDAEDQAEAEAEPAAQSEAVSPLQPSGGGAGPQLIVADTPAGMPATSVGSGEGLSLQQIYRKVLPSVVSITSTLQSGSSTGTGIVMSEDGYLITNEHVVEDALAIDVLTSDDESFSASLIGSDETSDLAVLKIDAEGLSPAEFGDSDQMEVGDAVVAIGDPLGSQLRGTMTDGIISAINRDLVVNGRSMTLMQTNAALNNGNSGGPLINAYGQVIGINTMKMSSVYSAATVEGLGFAIPIATAKPIIDELIAQGYVSGRPALGIQGRALPTAVQAYYHLPNGIYIESVDPESDAYAKGIREGDTLLAIEGVEVETVEDLNVVKNQHRAGDTVELTIYRAGETYLVEVTLSDAAAS